MKKLILLVIACTSPLAAAAAAPVYTASFAAPAAMTQLVSSDRLWSCDGSACRAGGDATSPARHICARLAKEVGAVTAFSAKGRDFSAEEVAQCNARAGHGAGAAAAK